MTTGHRHDVKGYHSVRWSKQEERQLVAWRVSGMTWVAIGKNLGRTPEACRRRCVKIVDTRICSECGEQRLATDFPTRMGIAVSTCRACQQRQSREALRPRHAPTESWKPAGAAFWNEPDPPAPTIADYKMRLLRRVREGVA